VGRVVLVVAQAGSGKSSLVSQWSQENAPGRVAWLSLDAHHNEPARFLHYLCAALERVAPHAAGPVRALLESSAAPAPDGALTLLLNGLAALEQPVTLVLDDYHTLEAPAAHQITVSLLEHRPPTLCLILVSRSDPPLPLARLRARGELVELRGRDLRFTVEEASCFLNERMALHLAPEAIRRLTERAEGWIAGLQLAALSLRGHPDPEQFVEGFSGSHRFVVDYLMEEVVGRQPEEVRAFLRQTAILEQLCGPLCEAVTGMPGGQAMLERLEADNLFLIPLDEERRWYRYHHLFAEVLRARPAPLPWEEAAALHGRAAAWYETQGMAVEALAHAIASGDFEEVLGLLEARYEALSRGGEPPRPEEWLRAVGAAQIQDKRLLSLAMASISLYLFRYAEAEEILGPSGFELPENALEAREWEGRRLTLLSVAARLQGQSETAEARARQALALVTPASHLWRSLALQTLGQVYADRGDLRRAIDALAEARREAEKIDSPTAVLRAGYGYGEILESQGRLQEAERFYQEMLDYLRQRHAVVLPLAALLFAALGRLRCEQNDLPGALAHLEEALERTRAQFVSGDFRHAFVCLFEMLRLRIALGETAAADALFERLTAACRGPAARFFEPVVAALRVQRPETPAGEVDAWLKAFEARTAGGIFAVRPMPEFCPLDAASLKIGTWARLRLARGETEAVVARLERFLDTMVAQGRHGSALPVRALLAALHWEAGRPQQAVAVLEPALSLAAREGYVRSFLEAGGALAPVLRAAAARGIEPETGDKLLAALEPALPAPVPLQGSASPQPGGSPHPTLGAGHRPSPPPPPVGTPPPASEERPEAGLEVLVEPLTERELEVLRLAAAGLSNEAIAAQLFLSTGTVKRHLHNIYGKLGVTGRFNAVARARELGLL
jgi:LuxR family maltose regulon positive regulatory protein